MTVNSKYLGHYWTDFVVPHNSVQILDQKTVYNLYRAVDLDSLHKKGH